MKGLNETARRTKQRCGKVFRHAIGLGYPVRDLTPDLRGLLEAPQVEHHAALTDPREVGQLLLEISGPTMCIRTCPHEDAPTPRGHRGDRAIPDDGLSDGSRRRISEEKGDWGGILSDGSKRKSWGGFRPVQPQHPGTQWPPLIPCRDFSAALIVSPDEPG